MAELLTAYWPQILLALLALLALVMIVVGLRRKDRAPTGADQGPELIESGPAPGNTLSAPFIAAPVANPRPPMAGELLEPEAETITGPRFEPEVAARLAAMPEAEGEPDNLQRLKGLGPKLAARLAELGITRFAQIAAWTAEDVAAIDRQLSPGFRGRIERDGWVEQARLLAAGDVKAFEERFGRV